MAGDNAETNSPTDLYGYIPSKAVAVIFLALFLITTFTHVFQAIKYRRQGYKFMLLTAVFCGIIELLGWSGRLWSSFNSIIDTPFQIQISCTIIAPTPLLAANFVIFGRITRRLGTQYSRLRPRLYTIFFASADVISLVVQAMGGGIASAASTPAGTTTGSNVMLAGIVFQLVIIILYSTCLVEYIMRYTRNMPHSRSSASIQEKNVASSASDIVDSQPQRKDSWNSRVKTMVVVLCFTTTLLFIRAVYRVVELADGWDGRIIHTQVYFNILDATMVVVAMYTLNAFHPGRLLSSDGAQEPRGTDGAQTAETETGSA